MWKSRKDSTSRAKIYYYLFTAHISIYSSVAPMSRYIICICRYNCIGTVSESVKTISVLSIWEITYVRGRSRINAHARTVRTTIAVSATIAVACCKRRSAKQCHAEKKIANMELLYCRRQRSPSNLQYLQRYRTQRRSICKVFYYNLVGHLRKHPTEFRKFEDEKSAAAS